MTMSFILDRYVLINWAKMINKSGITIYFIKKINVLLRESMVQ